MVLGSTFSYARKSWVCRLVLACSLLFFPTSQAVVAQEMATQASVDEVLANFLSNDPEAHDAAVLTLVQRGGDVIPELERQAADARAHPQIRAGVILTLGRIGAESSQSVLTGLWEAGIESLGGGLAIQVAMAIAEYGDVSALEAIIRHGDEVLGAKAAVQLGLHGSESSTSLLLESWSSENYARMRIFFAIALGLVGDESGRDMLEAALRTPELRNHCAIALGKLGSGSDVAFELEFAMEDRDPLVRLSALDSLIDLAPSGLARILESSREDPDPRVTALAERAQERLNRRNRRRR